MFTYTKFENNVAVKVRELVGGEEILRETATNIQPKYSWSEAPKKGEVKACNNEVASSEDEVAYLACTKKTGVLKKIRTRRNSKVHNSLAKKISYAAKMAAKLTLQIIEMERNCCEGDVVNVAYKAELIAKRDAFLQKA